MKRLRWIFIGILALTASVVITGLMSVSRTEYATGWDGYYYLVQIKSFETTGEMHSPEYSLIYLPLMAFNAVSGNYITAYRLTAVAVKLFYILSVYAFCSTLLKPDYSRGGIRHLTALTVAALSAASPSLNYFFTQFPKNLMGFCFMLLFAVALMRQRKPMRKDGFSFSGTAVTLLLFVAAFFTHRFSAVMSMLFGVLFLGPPLLKGLLSAGRKKTLVLSALIAVVLVTVLFLSSRLPLAPSAKDIERVATDLSGTPVFVPAAFVSVFGTQRLSATWQVEIWAGAGIIVLTLLMLPWKRFRFLRLGRGYSAIALLAPVGLFPFFHFELEGISYRLFFATMLLVPLVAIPWILAVTKLLRPGAIKVLPACCATAASFFTYGSYAPEIHDPPYEYYSLLAADIMDALKHRNQELIVAHKALAELITYTYMADALPWSPEEFFQRDRVWRVTAGVMKVEVSYYLNPEAADSFFIRLRGDYGLMREDAWEEFLLAVSSEPVMMDALDNWRNPMETRPAYLVRNDSAGGFED